MGLLTSFFLFYHLSFTLVLIVAKSVFVFFFVDSILNLVNTFINIFSRHVLVYLESLSWIIFKNCWKFCQWWLTLGLCLFFYRLWLRLLRLWWLSRRLQWPILRWLLPLRRLLLWLCATTATCTRKGQASTAGGSSPITFVCLHVWLWHSVRYPSLS